MKNQRRFAPTKTGRLAPEWVAAFLRNQWPESAEYPALADTYDALISQRAYKPPLTHEEAVRIIVKDKGTHFDPEIVDAFLTVSEEFRNIAREHSDSEKQEVLKPDDRAAS